MIPRLLEKHILVALAQHQKAVLILGARQVGKTTLLKKLKERFEAQRQRVLFLNCDVEEDRLVINTTSRTKLGELVHDVAYLLIDEAQRLDNPGLTVKVVHDLFPDVRLVVTGSSSFELKNSLSDALTGRYLDFTLYPLSLQEVAVGEDLPSALQKAKADSFLDTLLLFGSYPEIYNAKKAEDKKLFLEKMIESYLFKDILSFQKIRHPQMIKDLTRALAYQIGSEVNENELANRLKIDRKTVVSYLDILEQSFVIARLSPFSKNPRREIGKRYKVYFTDIGIRNALLGDFNPFHVRADRGALWENFLIMERTKYHANRAVANESHFWRSYSGAEVDYLERLSGEKEFHAYEIKYSEKRLSKGSHSFVQEYQAPVTLINRDNYLEFIAYGAA